MDQSDSLENQTIHQIHASVDGTEDDDQDAYNGEIIMCMCKLNHLIIQYPNTVI